MSIRGLLTTNEVAEILGVSTMRVHQFREDGRISGSKIGNVWLYDRHEVEAFSRVPRLPGTPGHGVGTLQAS